MKMYPLGVNRFFPQDNRDLPRVMIENGNWSAQAIFGSDMNSVSGSSYLQCWLTRDEIFRRHTVICLQVIGTYTNSSLM